MKKLEPLIPGIYADEEGRALLNMREFLEAHGFPDAPELRAVIWEEIREIFGDVEVESWRADQIIMTRWTVRELLMRLVLNLPMCYL
jgi:hypothetical protein